MAVVHFTANGEVEMEMVCVCVCVCCEIAMSSNGRIELGLLSPSSQCIKQATPEICKTTKGRRGRKDEVSGKWAKSSRSSKGSSNIAETTYARLR